ncbi:hypothetical protein RISK_001784 [Rhodopirellula islandica]|uniref:Uncharacterized protein n=1 Tax=Rhodopirellula islandica TaxID=595434 RepID=A0A0J1BHF3_RHOIS|nr:hypothetical protein RISK_001784 [Rhodopirellula islandica]
MLSERFQATPRDQPCHPRLISDCPQFRGQLELRDSHQVRRIGLEIGCFGSQPRLNLWSA